MKHMLLAATILLAVFNTSMAGNRNTKAENDAAMKTARKEVSSSVSELQKSVASHNAKSVEIAALKVLDVMRAGMAQAMTAINFKTGEEQKAANLQYNKMEKLVYEYTLLTKDASNNSQKLVEYAQAFVKQY